jgi:hypothetical protein
MLPGPAERWWQYAPRGIRWVPCASIYAGADYGDPRDLIVMPMIETAGR